MGLIQVILWMDKFVVTRVTVRFLFALSPDFMNTTHAPVMRSNHQNTPLKSLSYSTYYTPSLSSSNIQTDKTSCALTF